MHDPYLNDLVTAGLHQYGLENAALTRLGGASNANVRAVLGDTAYVLRLDTSMQHDATTIRSELTWLRRLHTDTALVLPTPIGNLHGDVVTRIAAPGRDALLCTCMTWVDGRTPPTVDAMTDTQLTNAGAVMAHLHQHAQHFHIPPTFMRPTFDATHYQQRLTVLVTVLSTTDIDHAALRDLMTRANQIITYVEHLERPRTQFGLIHADFHSGNYVLLDDEVRIIDFDRCGFGFYLYDLALALMELGPAQRHVFMQGYQSVQSLPVRHTDHLTLFLCLAYLDNLGFLAAHPEEVPFIVKELPQVREVFDQAMQILTAFE